MTREYEAVRESAIADAYMMLALVVDYPSRELAEGLLSGAFMRDAAAIAEEAEMGDAWAGILDGRLEGLSNDFDGGCEAESLFSELRVEHTRLFEHPVKPVVGIHEGQFLYDEQLDVSGEQAEAASKPRKGKPARKEDFYDERPRLFVNPAALDAERCYRGAGLKRSDEKNVPGDNMVTELQFMSRLHGRRAQALLTEDAEGVRDADASIEEFERIHLRKWAEAFFRKVKTESRIEAYRLAGALGESFFAWRLRAAE